MLLVSLIFALLTACSSIPGDKQGSKKGPTPTEPAGGDEPEESSDASESRGPSTGNAEGGDGGGELSPMEKLFPLEVGHEWTYSVEFNGLPSTQCPGSGGERTLLIEAQFEVDGKKAFESKPICEFDIVEKLYYALSDKGVESKVQYTSEMEEDYRRLAPDILEWRTEYSSNLEDGHQWVSNRNGRDFESRWTKMDTFENEHGQYTDCWKTVYLPTPANHQILCRGHGLVEHWYTDLSGGSYRQVLLRKNF